MKALRTYLCLLLASFAVSGCVDLEVSLRLDEDGSGELDILYGIFVGAEDDFARFASILRCHPRELDCDPRAEVQPKLLTRELLEPQFKNRGVRILKCNRSVGEEWDTVELSLEFANIDSLSLAVTAATRRYSGSFQIAEMQAGSFVLMFDRSIPPTELFWQWFPDSPAFPIRSNAALDSLIEGSSDYAMAYLVARDKYLSNLFRAKLELDLPAIPFEHNADSLQGTKCIWEFGPEDINGHKVGLHPFAEFPGEGLSIVAMKSKK